MFPHPSLMFPKPAVNELGAERVIRVTVSRTTQVDGEEKLKEALSEW